MAAQIDHAGKLAAELSTVQSSQDFCKDWQQKWRPIAVAAQGLLKIFFPPAATVLGFLIDLADKACPMMSS